MPEMAALVASVCAAQCRRIDQKVADRGAIPRNEPQLLDIGALSD